MRQLPSESIDLIYIDPPFFSQRNYNVIWGDKNEERSFNDIWEGGLDGYLIWLNARLYEMKRLLKPTGSIYVHCDWHASHYIKVEMDKIFGYENFRNEIIWHYGLGGYNVKRWYPRKHDVLFYYAKSVASHHNKLRGEISRWMEQKYSEADDKGRYFIQNGTKYYLKGGKPIDSVWDLDELVEHTMSQTSSERVGYPTQKPLAVLERVIEASSRPGDLVFDAFCGGGGTAEAAQRLNRRWIACDQSRVAIAVTAERMKNAALERTIEDSEIPDFTIEHWGVYEATKLAEKSEAEFRQFVLDCYNNCTPSNDEGIHAYQGQNPRLPIWVGQPKLSHRASEQDVIDFASAIRRIPEFAEGQHRGIMLAWGFLRSASAQAAKLADEGQPAIDLVRLEQVKLDSSAFRKHIADLSTERGDYSEFLTFVQSPRIEIDIKRLGPRNYQFTASMSKASNAKIINVQWDFDYNEGKFRAAPDEWFQKTKNKNAVPSLVAQHTFPGARKRIRVACRIQDDKGGEGMWSQLVDVE